MDYSKKNIFYNNGLVCDTDYYKKLERNYTIGIYPLISCPIKELLFCDFDSLNGQNWLTSFAIDIIFELKCLNTCFAVIPCEISTAVLNGSSFSDFITDFFLKKCISCPIKLVMPFLVNGNHYNIVIISENIFLFIDPYGENMDMAQNYYQNFIDFLEKIRSTNQNLNEFLVQIKGLHVETKQHLLQRDGYNCGPLIVNYFEKIVQHENLNEYRNMDAYRKTLQICLLENSQNMREICTLCGRQCPDDIFKCNLCCRQFHQDCLQLISSTFLNNSICQLCKNY